MTERALRKPTLMPNGVPFRLPIMCLEKGMAMVLTAEIKINFDFCFHLFHIVCITFFFFKESIA